MFQYLTRVAYLLHFVLTATVAAETITTTVPGPKILSTNFEIIIGEPFTLNYTGCDTPCTLTVMHGPWSHPTKVKKLTTNATGNNYTGIIDTVTHGFYFFQLQRNDDGEKKYSMNFPLKNTVTDSDLPTQSAPGWTSKMGDAGASATSSSTDRFHNVPTQKGHSGSSNDSGSHLSSEAIAGIAIGAVSLVALLVGGLIFAIMKRRREQKKPQQTPILPEESDSDLQVSQQEDSASVFSELPKEPAPPYSRFPLETRPRGSAE